MAPSPNKANNKILPGETRRDIIFTLLLTAGSGRRKGLLISAHTAPIMKHLSGLVIRPLNRDHQNLWRFNESVVCWPYG